MSDKKDIKAELSPPYTIVVRTDAAFRGVCYKIISNEEFLQIHSREKSQLVYWSEIVQRMHVCAATSVKRIKKWFDATIAAYNAENHYGFCAGLRGLIEACADSSYTLSKVIDPICAEFAHIEAALNARAKRFILSEAIEDELIHYSHARALAPSERGTSPKSHKAQHPRVYMDSVRDPAVRDFYSELCQVSHPSAMSLNPFLTSTDDYALILHPVNVDGALNDSVLRERKQAIVAAATMAIGPAMCVLKMINEFDTPMTESLRTSDDALQPIVESDLWREMARKIRVSKEAAER